MSTATPVSICSNALLMLGDTPISSFDGSTKVASLADALYDSTRDSILRVHPWNCAVKRVTLNPDAEAPAFDFARQFTLPGDFLRTLQVGDRAARPDFRHEGRRILCSAKEGDTLLAGERYGIIRFGSRTDIYLPEGVEPLVVVGQRTVGGETVLAELGRH